MHLFLLRHAHSVGNEMNILDSIGSAYDLGLSVQGKKEAAGLVKVLKKHPFDVIIVSPLSRTKETVRPYLELVPNVKIVVSPLTLERNAGDFTGQDKDAMKKYCEQKEITDTISFRPPHGESIRDVFARAKRFLAYLRRYHKDKKVLVCGHKNFLNCLEIVIQQGDIKAYCAHNTMNNGEIRKFVI